MEEAEDTADPRVAGQRRPPKELPAQRHLEAEVDVSQSSSSREQQVRSLGQVWEHRVQGSGGGCCVCKVETRDTGEVAWGQITQGSLCHAKRLQLHLRSK